jgi:riboflavin kinase/FMN adenylyltransferase
MNAMNEKTIFALGFFDGVHLGHQALLDTCREMSARLGARPGVVTFIGHPDTLVAGKTPPLINTAADREMLLHRYGMERVETLNFDRALMKMPWEDFFAMLLSKGAAGLVCGQDFRFGHRGAGNAEKLRDACREAGIPCTVVEDRMLDGLRISSSHIRMLLEKGEMAEANRFLGHPHILTGEVVPGRQLGRTIGIPTANLRLPQGLLTPAFGVYACRARVDGETYLAVTNIGTRPTVEGHHVTVEPWLLDFDGDLYGKQLMLEFHAFLRPEQKFASLEELKAQIQKDAAKTRALLG